MVAHGRMTASMIRSYFEVDHTGGDHFHILKLQTEQAPMESSGLPSSVFGVRDSALRFRCSHLRRGTYSQNSIDVANPAFAPMTDITGAYRDSMPDMGAYEYPDGGP